jgi:uncharacterized membrane protein
MMYGLYNGGYNGMMGGGFGFIVALVVMVDLVLLGVWLFKHINK